MRRINFLNHDLFAFTEKAKLQSKFSGMKSIADFINFPFDESLILQLDPEKLFAELIRSPIDLQLIQVFALMGWDGNQWKSAQGRQAMKHWWLSVLEKDREGEPLLRLVMVLRTVLADLERYPAPIDVVKVMRDVLEDLIRTDEWGEQTDVDILLALISGDAKTLAKIAMREYKNVVQLVLEANFPKKLLIIHDANIEWLSLWIQSSKKQRQIFRQPLNALLNKSLPLEQQCKLASSILNHNFFSLKNESLEQKVKDYPELVAWLSACARNTEFKLQLTSEERQRLGCWIGFGNYESLRQILVEIAQNKADEGDLSKTTNRYIFWKNYQALFQEAWLLLPHKFFVKNKTDLSNVKELQGADYPVVVLKIQNYFVFQYFLGTAANNDLLMTDDIHQVEQILNQRLVLDNQLKQMNLVLIHDHLFKWQSDLAYTLDQHFKIQAKDQRVYFAEGQNNYSYYLTEVQKSEFKDVRKQWKNLPQWVKHNLKNKYPSHIYQKAALTAQRYDLLS